MYPPGLVVSSWNRSNVMVPAARFSSMALS
jgi:hypothetical protein